MAVAALAMTYIRLFRPYKSVFGMERGTTAGGRTSPALSRAVLICQGTQLALFSDVVIECPNGTCSARFAR